jgi:peptidoglycan hydrolase CwlO-like protein
LRKDIVDLKAELARKNSKIADQAKEMDDKDRKIMKLENKLKESEADFVHLSNLRKEEGLLPDRPSRPNFFTAHLKSKGKI